MEIQRKVIEYRIVGGTGACGRAQRNTFPARIEAPVQYGPGVSAFAVYMTQYQLLPYQRTAEGLNELAGLGTSSGILQRAVRVAATCLLNVGPRPRMRSACWCRSLAYSCMITGRPASATHVGRPSAMPIIYVS